MGQYTSYYLYQRYEKRGDQPFIPSYPAVYSIDGNGTKSAVIKNENDINCGYSGDSSTQYRWVTLDPNTDYVCDTCPMYRWVTIPITSDYVCVGTTKYYKEKQQISYDNGETWEDTGSYRTGAVYETQSEDCGYVPPTPLYRWVDTGEYMCVEGGTGGGYLEQYLTTEALENNAIFTLTIPRRLSSVSSISYSIDDGLSWTTFEYIGNDMTIQTPIVNTGGRVLWKGLANTYMVVRDNLVYRSSFSSTRRFNAYGNMMSMLYGGIGFVGRKTLPTEMTFSGFFKDSIKLVSAEYLMLPATTLTKECYKYMFQGCTSLTKAPMFLPATTLANDCYYSMFSGCTSLATAQSTLPATTLASSCYAEMFKGCTSLTVAPELPATTLTDFCYASMFWGCTNLHYIKCLATDVPSTYSIYSTGNWVYGVSSSGTFVKNAAATDWAIGDSGGWGIPSGWTIQDA